MAQRKLQQEVDRCFKRVAEGIQAFESLFEKINQTSNSSQKEKLEDALKREIKKLQRHRDQIKTWAASNEIKDKKPLLEHRKLIETQMERFKAVEKEMKTKAYSKEGLSAAAKLDPREKEKAEVCEFLSNMVAELERQIEQFEAESETLQATLKKGRKDTSKAERVAEIERSCERHKWHQSKLELILRLIENGGLEVEQVNEIREDVKFYVEFNQDGDFAEDEDIYEALNLQEEEEAYGVGLDNDRTSSADNQSVQDEPPEKPNKPNEPTSIRRPSTQMKSPMPAVATLSSITNGAAMKPAPAPPRIAGETLKYSSAAAAAAAADKNVGIAPLPPPPGLNTQPSALSSSPMSPPASIAPLPAPANSKPKPSPQPVPSIPAEMAPQTSKQSTPAPSIPPTPLMDTVQAVSSTPATQTPASSYAIPVAVPNMQRETSSQSSQQGPSGEKAPAAAVTREETTEREDKEGTSQDADNERSNSSFFTTPNDIIGRSPAQASAEPQKEQVPPSTITNGTHGSDKIDVPLPGPMPYNLPPGLRDLLASFEAVRAREVNPTSQDSLRLLAASAATLPLSQDAERPNHYKPPTEPHHTPQHYPQEVPAVFDDENLFRKVDTDTLFYVFYYCQGTYQQYMAAQQLKRLSWRFHKQYQTWFQRHEEPRAITEEYEQGTYRFFDYESTWMNRRKSDFKFAYKFLEDDIPT